MTRLILTTGAVYGLLAVALGAFGAHGLQHRVAPELLVTWATASDYLAMHALALLAIGSLSTQSAQRETSKLVVFAAWCFVAGAAIFSGSLFLRVVTDVRAWGAVTPIGGTVLIAGWATLAIGLWRQR